MKTDVCWQQIIAGIALDAARQESRAGHCCFSGCQVCDVCGGCFNSAMHGLHHLRFTGGGLSHGEPVHITFEKVEGDNPWASLVGNSNGTSSA